MKNSTNHVYMNSNHHAKSLNEKIHLTTFSIIFNKLSNHRNHLFKPGRNGKIETESLRDEHSYMQLAEENYSKKDVF